MLKLGLSVICLFCNVFNQGNCQLPTSEQRNASESQCLSAGSITATCPVSTSIAMDNIRVGVHPESLGCNGTQQAGDGSGCCEAGSGCEFDFPLADNTLYHDGCNGRQTCTFGKQQVDTVHGGCNTTIYPRFTNYKYFNFYCIDDSRITELGSSLGPVVSLPVYLQSPGYPFNIPATTSSSACSVEIDNCNAVLQMYIIERNLAEVSNLTVCTEMQSLSIIDTDGSVLANWTCATNTYTISPSIQSTDNYITVNFTNTMTNASGKFWIGFSATMASNISINCPAADRTHCLPTTITPNTTTANSTTITPATTTTNSTTITTTNSSTSATTSTNSTTTETTSTNTTESTSMIMTTIAPVQAVSASSSSTNITLVIVVCGCLGAVVLVVIIISLIIWRKKRRKPVDEDPLINSKDDNPPPDPPETDSAEEPADSVAIVSETPIVSKPEPKEKKAEPDNTEEEDEEDSLTDESSTTSESIGDYTTDDQSVQSTDQSIHEHEAVEGNVEPGEETLVEQSPEIRQTHENPSEENDIEQSPRESSPEHVAESEVTELHDENVKQSVDNNTPNEIHEPESVPDQSPKAEEEKEPNLPENDREVEEKESENQDDNVPKINESTPAQPDALVDPVEIETAVLVTAVPRKQDKSESSTKPVEDSHPATSTSGSETSDTGGNDSDNTINELVNRDANNTAEKSDDNSSRPKVTLVKVKSFAKENPVEYPRLSPSTSTDSGRETSLSGELVGAVSKTSDPSKEKQPREQNKVPEKVEEEKTEHILTTITSAVGAEETQKSKQKVINRKRLPKRPKTPAREPTKYERYYESVAIGFTAQESFERKLDRLIKNMKAKKKIMRKRKNNVVVPEGGQA